MPPQSAAIRASVKRNLLRLLQSPSNQSVRYGHSLKRRIISAAMIESSATRFPGRPNWPRSFRPGRTAEWLGPLSLFAYKRAPSPKHKRHDNHRHQSGEDDDLDDVALGHAGPRSGK